MLQWIRWLWANEMLEKAVKAGDAQKTRKALSWGANANLEMFHKEPLNHATFGVAGAWTLVNDGDLLSHAMKHNLDDIGMILADAGAKVPPHYHDRIVAQRWKHRVARSQA